MICQALKWPPMIPRHTKNAEKLFLTVFYIPSIFGEDWVLDAWVISQRDLFGGMELASLWVIQFLSASTKATAFSWFEWHGKIGKALVLLKGSCDSHLSGGRCSLTVHNSEQPSQLDCSSLTLASNLCDAVHSQRKQNQKAEPNVSEPTWRSLASTTPENTLADLLGMLSDASSMNMFYVSEY